MRILLVEDDKKLSGILQKFLEKEMNICIPAYSIEEAHKKTEGNGTFDLLILDVILPDGSGIDFCRQLRRSGADMPVIMLTSRRSTVDKISGLDAGADDYMPKPFSPDELMARIRAVSRRPKQTVGDTLVCGPLQIDVKALSARVHGQPLELMPKEYALLEYMVRRKNTAIPRHEMLRHVWDVYSQTGSNRLEVYIRYLRQKIENAGGGAMIKTVRGVGYKIVED